MPKRKKQVSLTEIAKAKLKEKDDKKKIAQIKKRESRKERKCAAPFCEKTFTWKDTKVGKKYCCYQCALNDPERLVGRKSAVDDEALAKLRYAFMVGANDQEACDYAGISVSALQNYQEKNPEFKPEKEGLKNTRVMKARIKVFGDIDASTEVAKWNLEKLRKKEYGNKLSLDGVIFNGEISPEHQAIADKLLRQMEPEELDDGLEDD
jgi:hypothetical protein